jgi:L-fucose isomerase
VEEKLLRWGRAAIAVMQMRGKSYLSIGTVSMGIAGSIPNPDFFREWLGMRNEYVDCSEIIRRVNMGIYDHEEYEIALAWVNKYCKPNEGEDHNTPKLQYNREECEEVWAYSIKMALIFRDLMHGNPKLAEMGFVEESCGHNAITGGFQGQRQWTDFYPNCDFGEAMCNTSFDWNGAREPYVLATENDTLNGLSMLFMKLLTNRAQMFADVRTFWSESAVKRVTGYDIEGHAKEAGGFIHLINSGACCLDACGEVKDENGNPVIKPWYDVTEKDIETMLKATEWCAADNGYFRGGGYSSRFLTRAEMPATMIRLNLVKGLGPTIQIAEGYTVALPDEVSDILWKRTDYTWPCTWFTPICTGVGPFRSAYDLMNCWGANHGAITYGHVGADLITMCSMLRIPVGLHNVPDEKIFRPAAWNAFGTKDLEGADYHACAAYGPLYK